MTRFTESYYRRFGGIARLYGKDALEKFHNAHICVVGLGGVGSWAAEALVRSGIGSLTLIDLDDICLSNTNRQLHATAENVGKLKTEVMQQRLKTINPDCHIQSVEDFINQDNLSSYFDPKKNRADFILDAIDSVRDKIALLAYCKRYKLKIITVGGAAGKKDPTKITIADLGKTIHDPLASKVRERLKYKYKIQQDGKGKIGIPCVYSTEQITYPQRSGAVCRSKKLASGGIKMDCETGLGSITTITATFGFTAVSHILASLV